jgi:predicted cobalt transporter CbtA
MTDIKAFLVRGALAGLVGGILAALFQWLVTEDQVRKAIAIEEAAAAASGDAHAHEHFSRGQQVIGGMLATGLYGVLLGLVFAVVAALLWARLPGRGGFGRAIRLATAAFVAWFLVPNLKYPANPPAVGDPDTVNERTLLYIAIVVISLVLAFLAWELWRRLTAREVEGAPRFAAVVGGYAVALGIVYLVLPPNRDAVEVPANLVWHFRLDSIAQNAILWVALGTVFGWLADRAIERRAVSLTASSSV